MCKCSEIVITKLDIATIQSAQEMTVEVDTIEPLEPCEKKIVEVSKKRRCPSLLDKTVARKHEERNSNSRDTLSERNDMEDDYYVSKVEKRRLGPVLNSVTQLLLIDSLFSNV